MRKYMQEVINAWEQGKSLARPSASTDGQNIFSYGTIILQGAKDGMPHILNETKYSSTTTNQQAAIRVHFYPHQLATVTGVPRGQKSLELPTVDNATV